MPPHQPKSLPFTPGVAGVDEAGRGPLAGPLVVAAVCLPRGFPCAGLTDSKLLSPAARAKWFDVLVNEAAHSIVVVGVDMIDRVNIFQATMWGMAEAVSRLQPAATSAVIDGNALPPGLACDAECLVKGDSRNAAIAAASVLAKVTRDRLMDEADALHPGYGFAEHHGYGCPSHIAAIEKLGPCPIHRRSFEPVKTMVNQPCLIFDV